MTTRKNIMLGTAGHVDHGKTALVKLLTGCDTDRLAEEKQRGLTIELGFAPCTMANEQIVGIVDVPGHVGFIRNMVAGAHGVDVVILVVAADDGVMPQTREHLDILTLMGIRQGLVAMTKIDLVDESVRQLVREDISQFVAGTFLEGKPVCGVSSITGEGFGEFSAALNAAVAAAEPEGVRGPFRQWIERSFSIRGFGTVASGIPVSGQVRQGDRLVLLPEQTPVRVRQLEVYGQLSQTAQAGECVAINLSDIEADALRRGQVLSARPRQPVQFFEAELTLLPHLRKAMDDYAEVHLHVGTAETMANVALLEGSPIAPGGRALVQLRCRDPLPVALRERFVIRGSGAEGRLTTLGGGRILALSDIKLRRKRPWTLQRLGDLAASANNDRDWLATQLRYAGEPITRDALAERADLTDEQTQPLLAALQQAGLAVDDGKGRFAHADTITRTAEAARVALQQLHDTHPDRLGFEPSAIAADDSLHSDLLALALQKMLAAGECEQHGSLWALSGRSQALSDEQQQHLQTLAGCLRRAGLQPPRPDELYVQAGLTTSTAEPLLQRLIDEGRAVRLDEQLVMHADAVRQAQAVALDLFEREGSFETVAFRDALGVSRKYAVPLLDYFDTIGWTVRTGSRRTPGKAARAAMESPGQN